MQRVKRVSLLVFSLVVLAGALFLAAPQPAGAKVCPPGWWPGMVTIYYSDASHSSVVCTESECDGSYCGNPTPYYRTIEICCNGN